MARPLHVTFRAGSTGSWDVQRLEPVAGEGLPIADRLEVVSGADAGDALAPARWALRGVTSNERYVDRGERRALTAVQNPRTA